MLWLSRFESRILDWGGVDGKHLVRLKCSQIKSPRPAGKEVRMIPKIAHIGLAVKNLKEAEKFYTEILSMPVSDGECHGELKASFIPIGDTSIELLQSTTPEGVISRFIEKKGEGVHHIAYQVDDIENTLAHLKSRGVQLIDKEPRSGAHNSRIAFINPKSCHGILIELVEPEKK